MLQIKAKILYNKRIKDNYFHMLLEARPFIENSLPGQFIEIRASDTCEPFLRRPLGIHRVSGASIEVLYEVVGIGTKILAQKKAGEFLDVIGPLGNGYSILNTQYSILIAGGMGVAPLVFLAEKLAYSVERIAYRKNKDSKLTPIVLIGAKKASHILCEKEFKVLGCDVKVATEDGSRGFKGYVSELLKRELSASAEGGSASGGKRYPCLSGRQALNAIYACGPRPMLKEISHISQEYNIPAQVSLEEHMACGIGACLGCVVKTRDGYKRVCKEGPVFNADEIVWE